MIMDVYGTKVRFSLCTSMTPVAFLLPMIPTSSRDKDAEQICG